MVHVYWDQGGMFGKGRCLLSKKYMGQASFDANPSNIKAHYMGKMEEHFIRNMVNLFNEKFTTMPTTIITEM